MFVNADADLDGIPLGLVSTLSPENSGIVLIQNGADLAVKFL